MEATKQKEEQLFSELLDSVNWRESKKVSRNMRIAALIEDAIKEKGWKKIDLAKALGKNSQSIITKWLSGTHNFTTNTLEDLGAVLGVNFFSMDKQVKPNELVFYLHGSTKSAKEAIAKSEDCSVIKEGSSTIFKQPMCEA